MDFIPHIELFSSEPKRKALILYERALVGEFAYLRPSPEAMDSWIADQWDPKING
jgi:hypothetical protein